MSRRRKQSKRTGRRGHPALAALSVVVLLGLVLALTSCPKKPDPGKDPGTKADPGEPAPKEDPAVSDLPYDPSAPEDRSCRPSAPKKQAERVAVYYMLVKYKGGRDSAGATRDKEAAGRRAQRLMRMACLKGADFLALAAKYSEAPQHERQRQFIFNKGSMDKGFERFEKAAFGMQVGQVSDAILTPAGFYVMSRAAPLEFSTAHVLVQYKGSKTAPPAIKRSKDQALVRAQKVHKYALESKVGFAVLAGRYSDSPSRLRGGVIRPVRPGINEKGDEVAYTEDSKVNPDLAAYAKAAAKVKVGEVTPVVETPYGFHVIKRIKLRWIQASHILVAYTGGEVEPDQKRSKAQARALARKLSRQAAAADADFAKLANEHSDDSATAGKGGDLGLFARGMKVPRLEQAAFALKPDRVSSVVETRYGFHVIKRTK